MAQIETWADKDTIIFITLDNTLTIPNSLMFSYNSEANRTFIQNLASLGKQMPAYNKIIATWYQQRKIKLVEPQWAGLITRLKAKGATVYALCSMPIELVNIEEKRYKELKDLGIILTSTVNQKEKLQIGKNSSWPARFYKGIIFTAEGGPSIALMEFLKITNISVKKMAIIGNIEYKLKELEQILRTFDMEYYNILYLGARELATNPDPELIKFQQQELVNNGVWMEDAAALRARAARLNPAQ